MSEFHRLYPLSYIIAESLKTSCLNFIKFCLYSRISTLLLIMENNLTLFSSSARDQPKRKHSDISEDPNNEDSDIIMRTFSNNSLNLRLSGLDMKCEEEEEIINDNKCTALQKHQGPESPKKKRKLAAKDQTIAELNLHNALSDEEINGITNRLIVNLRVNYLGSPVEADLVCFLLKS